MPEPDYFLLSELRALPDVSNATKYPEARCLAAAAYITAAIEGEVGTSFIERTVTDELHDGGGLTIALGQPFVRSVTSATEDGDAVTDDLVADAGLLYRMTNGVPNVWNAGKLNVAVTYEAGYSSTVPADVKEQALQATRLHLMSTSSTNGRDARQTSLNTEMGVVGYVVAGGDRPTGYPELDALIARWRSKLRVFGFA